MGGTCNDCCRKTFRIIILLAMGILIVGLLSACGGGSGGGSGGGGGDSTETTFTIGANGGTGEVTNANDPLYKVKIVIPEGALDSDIEITIGKSNNNLALEEGMLPSGVAVNLGPDGTEFNCPVKLTIPYFDEDNDGILDGTNIPEEEISPMIYEKEMGIWLRKRVLSQDVAANTVTFETVHFSNYQAWICDRESYMAEKDVIFTIDGLSFDKTLYSSPDGYDWQRPSYLKRAFNESMNLGNNFKIISYAGLKVDYIVYNIHNYSSYHVESEGDSWSGNANQTGDLLEDLIENIEKEYMYAKRGGKKFIIVGHSWGTVLTELGLMYATDEDGVAVKPDLVLTLSAPRGAENVSYEEDHLFVEDTLYRTAVWFSQPLMDSNLDDFAPDPNPDDDINDWTVNYAESYISGYATDWIEYCQLRKEIFGINPNKIQFEKWVNYYFQGDIISGPISDTLGLQIEDRTVDYRYDERMNLSNTRKYHALTSLDEGVEPEGAWNNILYEDYNFVENAAIHFRELVKCDIKATVDGVEDCYSQGPCVDVDGDEYFVGHECGTLADCNDSVASIHPGANEVCGDGTDQDCNGADLTCQNCSTKIISTINANDGSYQVAMSPDGNYVIIGSESSTSMIFANYDGSILWDYEAQDGYALQSAAISSNGNYVVLGLQAGNAGPDDFYVLSKAGAVLWSISGFSNESEVAITDAGDKVFFYARNQQSINCYDIDGNLLWDVALNVRGWSVWGISAASDGNSLLVKTNSDIILLDSQGQETGFFDVVDGNGLLDTELSADGSQFVVSYQNVNVDNRSYIALYSVESGEIWRKEIQNIYGGVSMSNNGYVYASVYFDQNYTWDNQGNIVAQWPDPGWSIETSRNGERMIVGRNTNTATIYNLECE